MILLGPSSNNSSNVVLSPAARRRSHGSAMLCSFTQAPGYGGIARVSHLLSRVLQELYGSTYRSVTISPRGAPCVSPIDKVLFPARLMYEQMTGGVDWLLFDQLGLARAQRLVPRRFRRPYAVFLHSVEVWQPLSSLRRVVLTDARVRLANSHYTVSRIAEANPDLGSINVCHLSLPPGELRHDEKHVDRDLLNRVRPNSVIIVGRMEKGEGHKGHDRLIQAWPLVQEKVTGAQLVVVGDGSQRPQLQAEIHRRGVASNVLITGRVNESTLHALYSRAAVFAMPSSGEGFGLVFLEAMENSLPCIGSTRDATREVVVDGETGMLVDPADVGRLAECIITLLENAPLRLRMGRAGKERVRRAFSFDQFKASVVTALEPLIGNPERA
jgi:phosphatidylinositol alpha-1,6-mannosyltransferase